jgi:Phage integrase family
MTRRFRLKPGVSWSAVVGPSGITLEPPSGRSDNPAVIGSSPTCPTRFPRSQACEALRSDRLPTQTAPRLVCQLAESAPLGHGLHMIIAGIDWRHWANVATATAPIPTSLLFLVTVVQAFILRDQVKQGQRAVAEAARAATAAERAVTEATRARIDARASHVAFISTSPWPPCLNNNRGDKPDRWLFVGHGTEPPHQNTIGHRWRTTLKAAGLSGIKLHDLRHFYASGLIAAGCDVVTVQCALGALQGDNDAQHLLAPMADRRGSNPQRSPGDARRGDGQNCGLLAD